MPSSVRNSANQNGFVDQNTKQSGARVNLILAPSRAPGGTVEYENRIGLCFLFHCVVYNAWAHWVSQKLMHMIVKDYYNITPR